MMDIPKHIIEHEILKPTKSSATFIIAASNSKFKKRADYVCDGIADDVEIQAAQNQLIDGGKIILLEGTFTLSTAIHITYNNITIQGMGRSTTVHNILTSGNSLDTSDFVFYNCSYGIIDSIKTTSIIGILYWQNIYGVEVDGCEVRNCFIECTIRGITTYGNIKNCRIINNSVRGPMWAGGICCFFSGGGRIAGNTVLVTGSGSGSAAHGIAVFGYSYDVIIEGNVVSYSKPTNADIFLNGDHNLIRGNTCLGTSKSAGEKTLYIEGGTGNMIVENRVPYGIVDNGIGTLIVGNLEV